jgi:hypothetical protein
MTLMGDIQNLRVEVDRLSDAVAIVNKHEEQINGKNGLYAVVKKVDNDVQSLRRNLLTVGGLIFVSMVGFTISVLTVFGGH